MKKTSQPPVHPVASICPTCGSKRIRIVQNDFATTLRGRPVLIPNLARQECPACGEILFDRNALRQIESATPRKHRRTPVA